MSSKTARWLLVVAVFLAASCALPKAEVDETAASFAYTVDNVCSIMVPKLCAAREGCCNAFGTGYRADLCVARELASCQAGQAAYLAGGVDFHGDAVDACIAQASAFFNSCGAFSLDNRFLDQECTWVPFEGHHSEGGVCNNAFECAKSPEPRTFVQCEKNVCVYYRFVAEGAACSAGAGATRICDAGLYCDVGSVAGNPPYNGTCVKAAAAGTSCDQSFYCGYGNYCDAAQKCQPRKPPNSPCLDALECESNLCTNGTCTSFLASEPVCSNCPMTEVTDAVTNCDPLAQTCGASAACDLGSDGMFGCYEAIGSGTMYSVCTSHAECGTGLSCHVGRCTRPCCKSLAYDLCGPNGACNFEISDTLGHTANVCAFRPPCAPWSGGAGCSAPEANCGVTTELHDPACSKPSGLVPSPTIGKSCTYANDCEDSQFCDGTCHWLCKVQDLGAPPTGTVGGPPGQGGCPSGETCERFSDSTWLGYCTASGA